MTINGFNSVSGSIPDYQNTSVPTTPTQGTTTPSIKGIPLDTVQIASKSLFAGGTISNQVVKIRNSEVPGEVKGMHGGPSLMKTGKNVAIVSGIVSLARNTYDYIQGNVSGARAGGNISSDIVGGLGSGILAGGAGYLATMAIGSTFGAGVLGLVVGGAAFAGADILYRNSGAHQTVSDKVTAFIESILNRIKPGGGV
jgi:hypothetical protein